MSSRPALTLPLLAPRPAAGASSPGEPAPRHGVVRLRAATATSKPGTRPRHRHKPIKSLQPRGPSPRARQDGPVSPSSPARCGSGSRSRPTRALLPPRRPRPRPAQRAAPARLLRARARPVRGFARGLPPRAAPPARASPPPAPQPEAPAADPRPVPPPVGMRPRAPPGCRHARSAAADVTGLPSGPRTCCRPGAAPRCLLSGPRRASAAPSLPPSFPPCLPGAGWRRHCARARRAAAPSGRESPSGETGRRRRRPPQDGAAPKERLRFPASSARPRAGAPLPPRGTPGVVVRRAAAPRP